MHFENIENFIFNFNFLFLVLTLLFYWLQSASFLSSKESFLPNTGLKLTFFFQTLFLSLRWFLSGHFPLSNLYESLLFLSWVLTFFLIFLNTQIFTLFFQKKNLENQKQSLKGDEGQVKKESLKTMNSLFGSILMPPILLINTFATLSLPLELKQSFSLVPALKSNWLMMHVTFMLLSYGALLCGSLFAMAFLIIPLFLKSDGFKISLKTKVFLNESSPILLPFSSQKKYVPAMDTLDNLSYRIIGLGFPLLTMGILSGAIWANQTWGSYWSWDPKETWALITWLVFAIYLHTRLSYNMSGRYSAFIASFGFVIIWITYLGVNLLGKGLHSYGFFS